MKKIFFGLAFLSIIILFGCKKSPKSPDQKDSSIVGKWILFQTLTDPGDGSGTWMPASIPNYYFIQFNADKTTVESNMITESGSLTHYQIINDSTLNLIYSDNDTMRYGYKINTSILTLTGGCYEPCGSKFTRANP
jgi:hypothetical protein